MSDAREDEADVAGTEPPGSLSDPEARALAAAAAAAELSGPGVHVRFSGRSSVGLVREHNEDNLLIANLTTGEIAIRDAVQADTIGEGGHLFAVCDGMGGAAAGEVASQMAVDILLEALRRSGPPRERDELARRLVSAVEEAGKRIFESAQKERSRRGMGTTATVAVLVDKVLFIAEVGDSRAYLLRGGVLKQLTKDQSLVNQLIEAGHLTEAEAEAFEHSNIILQALGTSETVQVDLTFVELRRGDRLMLCSDGLSGLVHADSLRDTLIHVIDPSECAGMLTKYAEQGGGHDNITVVVVDFGGDGLPELRDTDTFGYLQYPLLPVAGAKNVYSDDEVTEATSSRSSMPPERLRSMEESSMPPSGGASSALWVSAGIVVLLGGAWLLAASGSNGSAATEPTLATDAPTQVAPADPKLVKAAPPAEPKPVQVRVFSDVRDAVLLVNGEPHGPLTMGQAASMQLKPGAYRFEAQTNGNIAAVEVATVRPEVPLEVNLRLPTGHSAEGENKAAEPSEGPAVVAPVAPEETPEPAAQEPKKAQHASATDEEPAEKAPRPAAKRKAQVSRALTEELNSGTAAPAPAPEAPARAASPAAAHQASPAAAQPHAVSPEQPPAAKSTEKQPPAEKQQGTQKSQPTEKPQSAEKPQAAPAEKPQPAPAEKPVPPGIPENPF